MSRPRAAAKWIGVLGVLGAAMLLYWFVARAPISAPVSTPASERELAADFTMPDLDGRQVALSSFRGKIVLLDFWATWCEPCLEELPDLARLHEAHKDKEFTLVGVAMDAEGVATVGPFAKQNRIPYPILVSGGDLPEGYPVPGFPSAFLIDADGFVVRRYLGPKNYDELQRDIAELLAP